MVLVPVREHDCPDLALTLAQVLEVGQNEVDAEVLVAREGEAGVDDDDPVVALTTVMFFPTSPRPPSGTMRVLSGMRGSVRFSGERE